MKLHSNSTDGVLTISSYDAKHIGVSGRHFRQSFLLMPQTVIESWSPCSMDELSAVHIDEIAQLVADLQSPIVLLGTGARQRFPATKLLRPLIERRVGVEIMDTYAACRTYNILAGEGRVVVAALILETAE